MNLNFEERLFTVYLAKTYQWLLVWSSKTLEVRHVHYIYTMMEAMWLNCHNLQLCLERLLKRPIVSDHMPTYSHLVRKI